MNICDICGRSNKRTKYYEKHEQVLCDSCLLMCKKYPVIYVPPKGELHYSEDGSILCHICGRGFKKLAEHIKNKHNMSLDEYKEKFELNRTCRLTGKNFTKPVISNDITSLSTNTRFKVGHKKK